MIQSINSLQVVQPDSAVGCGLSLFPRVDLRFESTVGTAPVARAVEDGCVALNFSVHGRHGPRLSAGFVDLDDLLWKLHAVPGCSPGQLSGSATLPGRSPFGLTRMMQLRLTNVSQTVCGMEGFPRIQLRGADGRPLPTHPTNLDVHAHAAILAPNMLAGIELAWGATGQCHQPSAASIDVTPPGLSSAFTISVGSLVHPVEPCDGAMYVAPVEEAVAATAG